MSSVARRNRWNEKLVGAYLTAKEAVISRGYASEIDWQATRRVDRITEADFMRESAWVVASSGFRESVVRSFYGELSGAFGDWYSAVWIVQNRERCRRNALQVFRSERKIDGILGIVERVYEVGFEIVKARLRSEAVDFLRSFPFMGPRTAYHLAKNLGLPVAKPDRHLVRIAAATGCESPQELCETVAVVVGDGVAVVDVVMWRYATIEPDYLRLFRTVRPMKHQRRG